MVLWKCQGCGYIHEDEQPPESCPKCGAPKESFVQLPQEQEEIITKSRVTNAAHMDLISMCEDAYEIAETIAEENLDPNCVEIAQRAMQDFEEIIQSSKAEIQSHIMKGKWG